jgi:manganese/zinc/iron transport system permease protein
MVWLTMLLAMSAAVIGLLVAMWLDVSVSGAMAAAAGVQFVAVWLLAPKRGLIARAIARRGLRHEVVLLAHLMHLASHHHGDEPKLARSSEQCLQELTQRGWIDERRILTASGYARLNDVGTRK